MNATLQNSHYRSVWRRLRRSLILTAVAMLLTSTGQARAPVFCNQSLLRDVDRDGVDLTTRYQPRGEPSPNRCEGTFAVKQAGRALRLRGLLRTCSERGQKGLPATLEVARRPAPFNVQLHFESLADEAYVLDARTNQFVFRWSNGVLRQLGLTREDLGLLAWSEADGRRIFVPLS